jgi:hypothetical protein
LPKGEGARVDHFEVMNGVIAFSLDMGTVNDNEL